MGIRDEGWRRGDKKRERGKKFRVCWALQRPCSLAATAPLLESPKQSSSSHKEHSFSPETVWVGTPPVYLSACLLRCMLSSQQPPAPVYLSQAFVCCSVLDELIFHVKPVMHSLFFFFFSFPQVCVKGMEAEKEGVSWGILCLFT
ncbi:hypothetical protein ATANTOWER_027042 [Ataeniobius toweri]|uniref:Uncharacterized protein n=1 Tax=Ataeniobius toweri TaxID=208326 RepID=A0ABU7A981_9TELE|nr:hypothetical protein [Ataeniobius toweri]